MKFVLCVLILVCGGVAFSGDVIWNVPVGYELWDDNTGLSVGGSGTALPYGGNYYAMTPEQFDSFWNNVGEPGGHAWEMHDGQIFEWQDLPPGGPHTGYSQSGSYTDGSEQTLTPSTAFVWARDFEGAHTSSNFTAIFANVFAITDDHIVMGLALGLLLLSVGLGAASWIWRRIRRGQ